MKKLSTLTLVLIMLSITPLWAVHYEKPRQNRADQARLIDHKRAVDLFYYGARYYDPALGRFITPDSVMTGLDSQALNPYSYCENNPTTMIDPSGHYPTDPDSSHPYWKGKMNNTDAHETSKRNNPGVGAGLTKTTPKTGGPRLRASNFSYDRGRKKFFNKGSLTHTLKSGLKWARAAMGAAATVLLSPTTLGDATVTGHKTPVALDTLFKTRSVNSHEDGEMNIPSFFEAGTGARARNYGKHLQFPDQDITLDTLYYVTSYSYENIKQQGVLYQGPYGLFDNDADAQQDYYNTLEKYPQSHVDGGIIASIVGNKNWVGFPIERGVWVNNPYCNQVFNSNIDTTLSNDLTEWIRSQWGN